MRLTRLDQKLVVGILGLFLMPGLLGGGVLIALYRWGAFPDAFTLLVTVVVGLAAMMAYLGLIAHTVGRSLVHTIKQLQLGTELMATVNPAHRLRVATGDEFELLSEEINRLADRVHGAVGEAATPFTGPSRPARPTTAARKEAPRAADDRSVEPWTALTARDRALDQLTYTVLDTETTGLGAGRGDRIVSIACVRLRDGIARSDEVFETLVNPGRPIPSESTGIHGITDAMVAEAPPIDQVLPDLFRFARGTVLAGHEVWFDLVFLREATDRLRLPPLTRLHPVLDTRSLSTLVHGALGDHDLDTVAARLGIVVSGRHSALGDALVTSEILSVLLELLRKRGIVSLGAALEATRRGQRAPPGR